MKYKILIAGLATCCMLGCAEQTDRKIESSNETTATENSTGNDKKDTDIKSVPVKQGNWKIDAAASAVGFNIQNFGKKVDGHIGGLSGTIQFDKDHPEDAKFDASVQVKTIDTDNNMRDNDLMGEKYFKEAQHPAIHFTSKKVEKNGNGYVAVGDLTIKGVSHEIRMPFDFTEKDNQGIFKSNFTINRHDYDIGGNGPIMGDDIHVQLKVVADKG